MRIVVNGRNVSVPRNATIADALKAAKINPETVLVKRKNVLVPHDDKVRERDRLELVNVISGG